MTSPLEYIDVQISREIPVVSRVGFGTLLFIGEKIGAERVASYGDLDALYPAFVPGDEEYKAAEAYFGQVNKPERIVIGNKTNSETYVEALNAIRAENDDWYALAIESRAAEVIEPVAEAINAQDKLFLAVTADADVIDENADDDIASVLLGKSLDRTAVIYKENGATAYPECGLAGRMLPLDPGSATWAWKTVAGQSPDSLSAVERATLEAKRATYYTQVAGNSVTFEGQTSAPGLFIDLIRGTDWLKYRMAEDLIAKLASTPKLPYIGGGEILEQIIRSRLDRAVDNQVIAEGYSLVVPNAAQQDVSDRANRIYGGITFDAVYTGAVHKIRVRGTITV